MCAAAGSRQRPIEVSQRPTTPISASILPTQPRSLMFRSDEDEENLSPTTLFNNFPERTEYPPEPSIFSNNDDDRSQFDYGSDSSADYASIGRSSGLN